MVEVGGLRLDHRLGCRDRRGQLRRALPAEDQVEADEARVGRDVAAQREVLDVGLLLVDDLSRVVEVGLRVGEPLLRRGEPPLHQVVERAGGLELAEHPCQLAASLAQPRPRSVERAGRPVQHLAGGVQIATRLVHLVAEVIPLVLQVILAIGQRRGQQATGQAQQRHGNHQPGDACASTTGEVSSHDWPQLSSVVISATTVTEELRHPGIYGSRRVSAPAPPPARTPPSARPRPGRRATPPMA